MSHVSKIEIEINDLASLKMACQRLGLEFREGQRTYVWYGRLVKPESTPLPEGITEKDLGKCHHAIHIPNASYEIGVIQQGMKYLLLADYWDSRLKNAIGENGGKLKQAYAVEKTILEARRKNYRVVEQTIASGIRLVLSA
ncbi:DUF1257 domain-containing protein [Fundidesulfovibrio terrae]|uniref:DUF1257 domain-containing protein n=1 Tax=Fundidesulfovibrio terrae TaxID=2922866 RepID=UPI001FB037B8|nr:DUF1257 domain-containing protein [Fundidesulfovibrio terrae]